MASENEIQDIIERLTGEVEGIEMDIEIEIPLIGKKKISELEKLLPWYLKLRGELKDFVPKQYDDLIMDHARKKGLAKQKRMNIEDLDIPLGKVDNYIETLYQHGYSVSQIAKLLNLNPMAVTQYFTDRRSEEKEEEAISIKPPESRIKAWLKKHLL